METNTVSDRSPVGAARGVLGVIEAHRDTAERDAKMAVEVCDAVGEAGLFALAAPADCGGLDATLPEVWEVMEVIAEADPTVSWHIANTGITGLVSSRLDLDTRSELYASPKFPYGNGAVPAGRATPVDGGYRLSGRWPFVTGSDYSQWNSLSGLVTTDDTGTSGQYGSASARVFIVPSTEVTIERTWDQASSMRGTGSHAMVVTDVFVPSRLAPSWTDEPLLDRPWNVLSRALGFGGCMASIELGMLRDAIDTARNMGAATSDLHGGRHDQQPRFQFVIADAEATWQSLQAGWHRIADQLWDAACSGEVPPALRAQGFSGMFHTVDMVRHAISDLYSISTNAAYRTQNRIDRTLRDSHAGAAAVESFRGIQRDAARVFGGDNPESPAF